MEKLEDKEKARISADMSALSEVIKDKDKFNKIIEILKEIKWNKYLLRDYI